MNLQQEAIDSNVVFGEIYTEVIQEKEVLAQTLAQHLPVILDQGGNA